MRFGREYYQRYYFDPRTTYKSDWRKRKEALQADLARNGTPSSNGHSGNGHATNGHAGNGRAAQLSTPGGANYAASAAAGSAEPANLGTRPLAAPSTRRRVS